MSNKQQQVGGVHDQEHERPVVDERRRQELPQRHAQDRSECRVLEQPEPRRVRRSLGDFAFGLGQLLDRVSLVERLQVRAVRGLRERELAAISNSSAGSHRFVISETRSAICLASARHAWSTVPPKRPADRGAACRARAIPAGRSTRSWDLRPSPRWRRSLQRVPRPVPASAPGSYRRQRTPCGPSPRRSNKPLSGWLFGRLGVVGHEVGDGVTEHLLRQRAELPAGRHREVRHDLDGEREQRDEHRDTRPATASTRRAGPPPPRLRRSNGSRSARPRSATPPAARPAAPIAGRSEKPDREERADEAAQSRAENRRNAFASAGDECRSTSRGPRLRFRFAGDGDSTQASGIPDDRRGISPPMC